MVGEITFWISLSAGILLLWLATLSYMGRKHVQEDSDRHKRRKEEMLTIEKSHISTMKRIFERLEQHDAKQSDFRVAMEHRLTRMETQLDHVVKATLGGMQGR